METEKDDKSEFERIDTVRIIKNNTSLQITIPMKWRELYDLKVGDWINLKILGIIKKKKDK